MERRLALTSNDIKTAVAKRSDLILWLIGAGLLFPLFFKLSGSIYNSIDNVVDSGGVISQLPLPVSVLICYGGMLLLAGHYRRATLAMKIYAGMVAVIALSLILAGSGIEIRKVILFIQVLLPMAGLILGQLVEDKNKIIPRAFLGVLLLIVPVQLVTGWVQGSITLTHYLYVFSVYQHFQYVPLILVCGFVYSMSMLWDTYKKTFYFLVPVMYLYVVASLSMLTIFAFVSFIGMFSFFRLKKFKKILAILFVVIALAGIPAYFNIMSVVFERMRFESHMDKGQYDGKFGRLKEGGKPVNVEDRQGDWKLYYNGITESAKTIIIGHSAPFPREVKTSAHNWYLDMAYNFGLISLLPIILLMIYTVYLLSQGQKKWSQGTVWLAAVVFYLVIVDSNFKVTLRQPYPGIFTYFMWGMLLSHFRSTDSECKW